MTTKNIVLQKARLAGDINNDGVIDKFDVELLRNNLDNLDEFDNETKLACDVTGNGTVTEDDVDALENIVRNKFFDVNATINGYEANWYKGQNENLLFYSISMPKEFYTYEISDTSYLSVNNDSMFPESYIDFVVLNYENSQNSDILSYSNIKISSDGVYTFSFSAKGTGTIEVHFDGEIPFLPCSSSINSQGYTSSESTGKSVFQLSNSWERYWVTFSLGKSSDVDVYTLRRFVLKNIGSVNCEIGALKMEEGNIATAYCPNKKDKYGLQVYLPLQNEVTNYGIADIVPKATGSASYTDGNYGRAFLSSSNNNIVFDNPITKDVEINSISMWVKFDKWSTTNDNVFMFGSDENGTIRLSYTNTGKYFIFISSDNGSICSVCNADLQLNEWYHIWFARDSIGGNRIYLNGELLNATATNNPNVGFPKKLRIGSDGNGYFNGAIRDIQIYTNTIPTFSTLLKFTFDSNKYDSSFRDVSGRWVYDSVKQVYKTTFDTEEGTKCSGEITLVDGVDVPDIESAYCDSNGIVTVELKYVPRYDLECVINYELGGNGNFYYNLTSDFYKPNNEFDDLNVDSYEEHYDIGTLDVPFVERYNTLSRKESLTESEQTEKEGLFTKLRNKLLLSSDMTKIQDSLISIQRYFSRLVNHEISYKIDDFQKSVDNYTDNIENVVSSINDTIENEQSWFEQVKRQLHDYYYFDFDNLIHFSNGDYNAYKTDDGMWHEDVLSDNITASRLTKKNNDGDFSVILTYVLTHDNTTVGYETEQHIYKNENGNWITEVIRQQAV